MAKKAQNTAQSWFKIRYGQSCIGIFKLRSSLSAFQESHIFDKSLTSPNFNDVCRRSFVERNFGIGIDIVCAEVVDDRVITTSINSKSFFYITDKCYAQYK